MRRAIVGVMGGGQAPPERVALARELGRRIAEAGWILLTGGRPAGVMEAASFGAKEVEGSLTLGILPTATESAASGVDVAIRTDLGNGRNNVNVLTSDVVVACGVDGPGTASEVALALKAERPVVLLAVRPEALAFFQALSPRLVRSAGTAEECVRIVRELLLQNPRT
jgi:hypothetical protein